MNATIRFLLVTFGFSWSLGLVHYLVVPDEGAAKQIVSTVVAVAFMFGPLVGAVFAQRAEGESVLVPLGVKAAPNRWWLVASLSMVVYALLALRAGLLLPQVEWSPDLSGFFARFASVLSPEDIAEAKAELGSIPGPLLALIFLMQALVAGGTINALAAFGEELGWRGFLFVRWQNMGFWKSAWLIGAIWGVWHAPLILQGHNYPEHPLIGVLMMVLWCMALSPTFHFIRLKTGSVVAASIMHGTLNAAAGLAIMFLKGGSDLEVGVTGTAGIALAFLIDGILWLTLRGADDS